MGLTIVAMGKIGIENPQEKFYEPNRSDFAYRNNPEQFAIDEKEYDRLVKEYEDAEEKATVGRFTIGYIGFSNLRRDLVELIGFGHFRGNPLSEDYSLQAKDIEDSKALNEFFLHSDCDGKLAAEQIAVLNKHIQLKSDAVSKSESRFVRTFADFVKKSAESKANWEFV